MYSLLFLTLLACALSAVFTPLVRRLATRLDLVDRPDGGRKAHLTPIPRIGGVALACAYVGSYAIWMLTPFNAGTMFQQHLPLILRLLPAAALVFLVGLLDDLVTLTPAQKLIGQLAAAGLAFAAGVRIDLLAGRPLSPGWSLVLTVFWLLICTNAFNLIDGMDGLAAGLGLLATITTLIASLLQGNIPLALATAPLAGSLLGFLRYNAPPASIFLGDSGSLLIGFALGSYAVLWSQKCATLLGLTAPVMAFAIPLMDVSLAIARRFFSGKPIFGADRGHIHHRLLERGFSPRRVVLSLYGVAAVAAVLSLLQSVMAKQLAGAMVVLFCVLVWLGVQSLGYVEFRVVSRLLRSGSFRAVTAMQIRMESAEKRILACVSPEECWGVLETELEAAGIGRVEARLMGRQFGFRSALSLLDDWRLSIRLSGGDSLTLHGIHRNGVRGLVICEFTETLREALEEKRRQWSARSDEEQSLPAREVVHPAVL